ncbi:MAG: pseudouridine synthase [Bacteroidota bacterium]|nr:pseudouridine synthase [Bacteroidota bacterium]
MRLNKYIASSGIASRRNSEELIKQGRVSINSEIVMDLASNVDPDKDLVEIDGEKISLKKFLYFLLNKPKGFITSTKDEKSRPVVIELIKTNEKIFPVGRLDYNTTGVLILTNDGDFSNLLTHPRNKVPKVYHAIIDRPLSPEDQVKLTKNLVLKDGKGRFEKVTFVKKHDKKLIEVTVIEGRNHFVKNMFGALGYNVLSLNRKSFAGIEADIPVGSYRKLTIKEVEVLNDMFSK